MKFAVTSLAFVLAAAVGSAFAADATPAKPMTAQQTKMSACSKDAHAKGLKGDEYKSFMSTCLKGDSAAAPAAPAAAATTTTAAKPPVAVPAPGAGANTPQRQKMRACSTDAKAKGLKGADRRTFMSTCLKGDAAPAAH